MSVDVIGLDHIYLAVSSLERAETFYDHALLGVLGFRKNELELGGARHVQYYNRLFGVVLRPAAPGASAHDAHAPGLHHLCFRVDSVADVERAADELQARGIAASAPRLFSEYAADYVATFFSDPDGIRLEITNFRAERRERLALWEKNAGAPRSSIE